MHIYICEKIYAGDSSGYCAVDCRREGNMIYGVYVYVCVHIYVYVYIHIYTYIYTHIYMTCIYI